MGYAHQLVTRGIHAYEWMRNAGAGGVLVGGATTVGAGFGGLGVSATAGGEFTITWRTDIATTATPLIQAVRVAATGDDNLIIRAVQCAGVGPTSAAVWMVDHPTAAASGPQTVNGTVHVLIHGEFTGTQVT